MTMKPGEIHLVRKLLSTDPISLDDVIEGQQALEKIAKGELANPYDFQMVTGRLVTQSKGVFDQLIFGPLIPGTCQCLKYQDVDPADQIVCDRCGVNTGDVKGRTDNWGLYRIPVGIFHPGAFTELCKLLGVSEKWLSEHGITALEPEQQALAECYAIGVIPIPPVAERPIRMEPEPPCYYPQVHPVNEAIKRLMVQGNRWKRLAELSAPAIIVRQSEIGTEKAFRDLLAVIAEPDRAREILYQASESKPSGFVLGNPGVREKLAANDALPARGEEDAYSDANVDDFDEGPSCKVLWLDADRLWIQDGGRSGLYDWQKGLLIERVPAHKVYQPEGVIGSYVLFAGENDYGTLFTDDEEGNLTLSDPYVRSLVDLDDPGVLAVMEGDQPEVLTQTALWDSVQRSWVSVPPDDIPLVEFFKMQPEDLNWVNHRNGRGAEVPWGGDRPGLFAMDRSMQYMMAGEEYEVIICDTENLQPMLRLPYVHDDDAEDLDQVLPDGMPANPDEEDWEAEGPEPFGPAAFGLRDGKDWIWLGADGIVGRNGQAAYRINGQWKAAGVSPDAGLLALLGEGKAWIWDPEQRICLAHFDLNDLLEV